MSKKLAIIAVSGLTLSAVCLGAAVSVGGAELFAALDFMDGHGPRCDFAHAGRIESRALDWNGDDKVRIALPANVHFRQGSGTQVIVKGDGAALSHIQVTDGTIRMDCRDRSLGRFDITLPGRAFRQFAIAGSGSLALENVDVPDLKLRVAGSGEITGQGRAANLSVAIAGSGEARLGGLAADSATLRMAGSGDAQIAARDTLKVSIAGSGKVRLVTEPKHLETHIAGSGEILHAP